MNGDGTNEWKVGAFIVGAVALLLVTLFWIGASRFDTDVVERVTYFDESVQGLDVGAPVKIRGVTIGKVTTIELAPDSRLVEVQFEIREDAMQSMATLDAASLADDESGEAASGEMLRELRVTVSAQGITGIKFLEADFFPPTTTTLDLSFTPTRAYVPSAPSTLKSLEDALRSLGNELPLAVEEFRSLARTLEAQAAGFDAPTLSHAVTGLASQLQATLDGTAEEGLGAEVSALIVDLRGASVALEETLGALAGPEGSLERASTSLRESLEDFRATLATADRIMEESTVPETSAAIRAAAESSSRLVGDLRPVTSDLPGLVRELRSTLRKLDELASLLQRDPGALLRGRAVRTDSDR